MAENIPSPYTASGSSYAAVPQITRDQVSTPYTSSGASSATITFPVNPKAGSTVLVAVANMSGVPVLADNGTSPSSFTADATNNFQTNNIFIFRANNITLPASGGYQISITSGGNVFAAGAVSYLNVAAGVPSTTSTPFSTGTSVTGGTGTGALIFAAFSDSNATPHSVTLNTASFTEQFTSTAASGLGGFGVADFTAVAASLPLSVPTAVSWTLGASSEWEAAVTAYLPNWQVPVNEVVLGRLSTITAIIDDGAGNATFTGTVTAQNSANWVNAVNAYGADPTGAADSFTAIQNALTAARTAGKGTVYLPPGTYLTSSILQIGSGTTLLGDSAATTTVKMKSGSWSGVSQIGAYPGIAALQVYQEAAASNITVRGITFDGNQTGITALPSWQSQTYTCSPVMLWNVTGLVIENCQSVNSIGYGIWPAGNTDFHIDRNIVTTGQVTAAQSWGTPTQQDGIHVATSALGTINGNIIDTGTGSAGDDGIAIQSIGAVCTDTQISGNTIRAAQSGIDLAISGNAITDITISGNNIWSTQQHGIVIQPFSGSAVLAQNITITGNALTGVCAANAANTGGIALVDYSVHTGTAGASWKNVTITGNSIQSVTTANAIGIYATFGRGLAVTGNSIATFKGVIGIAVGNNVSTVSMPVTGFTVSGNQVDASSNTQSGNVGIIVYDSGTGTVTGNAVTGPGANATTRIGISPTQASAVNLTRGVAISGNTVTGWDTGIQEVNAGGGNPDYNAVVGNDCHGNTAFVTTLGAHDVVASNVVA